MPSPLPLLAAMAHAVAGPASLPPLDGLSQVPGLVAGCERLADWVLFWDSLSGMMGVPVDPLDDLVRGDPASAGVDLDGPVWAVVGDGALLRGAVTLAAPERFTAFHADRLLTDARVEGAQWRLADGRRLRTKGSTVTLEEPGLAGASPLLVELAGAAAASTGCWLAQVDPDLAADPPGGYAINSSPDLGVRVRFRRRASEGLSPVPRPAVPPRPPVGRSVERPEVVVRLNGDLEGALEALAALPPGPFARYGAPLLDVLERAREAGLRPAVGAEVALEIAAVPQVVAVLPLERPRNARRVLSRLQASLEANDELAVSDGELLAVEGPLGLPLFIGAAGRALVVGTSVEGVRDVVEGRGDPWFAGPADQVSALPGLVGVVNARLGPIPVVPAFRLTNDGGGWLVEVPGMSLDAAIQAFTPAQFQFRPPEAVTEARPLVPDAPSTEGMAVLMLIQARQRDRVTRGEAPVGYSGGPRPLGELDGQAVPWEGVPELGVPPMQALCRYEIVAAVEDWTAMAWCDEDADGRPAVTMLRPEGRPVRTSPAGVR